MSTKNTWKKVLSCVLVCALILSGLTVAAFAADDPMPVETTTPAPADDVTAAFGWEGCEDCSEAEPHLIYTKQDLDHIRTHIVLVDGKEKLTGCFKLAGDIVFEAADFAEGGAFYNDGYGWCPIGRQDFAGGSALNFCGSFDGGGYTIEGLRTFHQTSTVGLFANVGTSADRSAVVKNFTLRDAVYNEDYDQSVQNGRPLGGVTANNFATISDVTIDSCRFYSVKGNIGAVVAGLDGGSVYRCTVLNTEVHGYRTPAGGNNNGDKCGLICGYANNDARIEDCAISDSLVTADSRGVGGIAGMQYGSTIRGCTVENCRIIGGAECVGGISGGNYAGDWTSYIQNCTVSGCVVSGTLNVGGLEGAVAGGTINCTLEDSAVVDTTLYLTGATLKSGSGAMGGLLAGVGGSVTATIRNCLACNVTMDSSKAVLASDSAWPIRMGMICGSANVSTRVYNVFASAKLIEGESFTRVAGVCTSGVEIKNLTPFVPTVAPENVYYVREAGAEVYDFTNAQDENYRIESVADEAALPYGETLTVQALFGRDVLPQGDLIAFVSLDEDVAFVDEGEVIPVGNGTAAIACMVTVNKIARPLVTAQVTVTGAPARAPMLFSLRQSAPSAPAEPAVLKSTKVEDEATGTVRETMELADGSVKEVETRTDGSTTTKVVNEAKGITTTTTVEANGVVVAAVAEQGKEDTASITIPETVKEAVVTIPTTVNYGMVAVDAATGKVIERSVPTENGMVVKVDSSVDVVIVNNAKTFSDVEGHWAENAIAFGSAHELFGGTGAETFAPDAPMTQEMLSVVLERFDGASEKADENAEDAPVAPMAAATGSMTREELALMLYRRMGCPEVDGDLRDFTDGDRVSEEARAAMIWAVQNGLICGSHGVLKPQETATRAQAATVFMRLTMLLTK